MEKQIGHGRSLDRLESSDSKIVTLYRNERKEVICEDKCHVFFCFVFGLLVYTQS